MNRKRVIGYIPVRVREMLESVYAYNSSFLINKKLLDKIVFAISIVDRRFFVQDEEHAYDDNALPIGKGQTISQPSTVARMLILADLQEGDSVLEIGAGSGWNASLIGFLVYPGSVLSADRISELAVRAQENLAKLKSYLKQKKSPNIERINKINFLAENAFLKKKIWKKKYNKIIITAGIADKKTEKKVREMAQNLLKQNGLLIYPYVSGPLIIYKKTDGKLKGEETKEHYVFVPLLEGLEE